MDPIGTAPRGSTDLSLIKKQKQAPSEASGPESAPPPAASSRPDSRTPLPPNPLTSGTPIVFGSQIFTGRFGSVAFAGFNPDYQVAVGDRVSVRMWGAYEFDATQTVDAQGNLFIPNVGPVLVLGVRNGDLNHHVEAQVKRIFRSNVGVYASLEAAQPVKVYVTGFVRAPGLYGGLSSDSILYYLDQAGGIDPDRGSYLEVDVLSGGKLRAKFDLYRFLLEGRMAPLQLRDGDTIVVHPRKHTVQVSGEVLNPYVFEFPASEIPATELLAMARPRPGATHFSIARKLGTERRSEYHPLSEASTVTITDGDEVNVTADRYPGTILVHVEGANLGSRTLVLPYGATLRDAFARIKPAPQANVSAVQLFRKSVAERQKEMLETSLRGLETYALTARSATSEEAALRTREADLIMQFIERARRVQPRGQIVLAHGDAAYEALLEDGDVLRIPEQSNLVLVSGEVLFPNALTYDAAASPDDYIQRVGGYNQGADKARLIILHQDGSVSDSTAGQVRPGDEIMVLPKIETKNVEVTRGITQIIYQIAVGAKILFGL